jgi:hypothetical protein
MEATRGFLGRLSIMLATFFMLMRLDIL